jgi:hypothetical protein
MFSQSEGRSEPDHEAIAEPNKKKESKSSSSNSSETKNESIDPPELTTFSDLSASHQDIALEFMILLRDGRFAELSDLVSVSRGMNWNFLYLPEHEHGTELQTQSKAITTAKRSPKAEASSTVSITEKGSIYGHTPIFNICNRDMDNNRRIRYEDELGLVTMLISNGADPAFPKHSSSLPCYLNHLAFQVASRNRVKILALLHQKGYDMRIVATGLKLPQYPYSIPHAAAQNGAVDALIWLKDNKFDLQIKDMFNRSPLHVLAGSGSAIEGAKFIMENGPCDAFELDHFGFSPFSISISTIPDFANFLLQQKAQVVSELGKSALYRFDFTGIELDGKGDILEFTGYDPTFYSSERYMNDEVKELVAKSVELEREKNRNAGSSTKKAIRKRASSWFRAPNVVRFESAKSSAVQLMVEHRRNNMLQTPLIRFILDSKWKLFAGRIYYRRAFFYALIYFAFLFMTIPFPTVSEMSNGAKLSLDIVIMYGIVSFLTLDLLLLEFKELYSEGTKWFRSVWNYCDLFFFMLIIPLLFRIAMIILGIEGTWWSHTWVNCASFLHILFGLKLLQFATVPRLTGSLVIMTLGTIKDVIKFFVFFVPLYVAFSNAYYQLYKESPHDFHYRNMLMMLLRWIFGDVTYSELEDTLHPNNADVAQVLFLAYMTTSVIILLNLLIAQMSNTFNSVVEDAEGTWLREFAYEILRIEATISTYKSKEYVALIRQVDNSIQETQKYASVEKSNWVSHIKERLEDVAGSQEEIMTRLKQLEHGDRTTQR